MKPDAQINYYLFRIHNPQHSEAVQKRLFELGFKWSFGGTTTLQFKNKSQLWLHADEMSIRYGDKKETIDDRKSETRELTLDDLYKPDCPLVKPQSVQVKLNDGHTAEVTKEGIKVGCTTFPLSVVAELAAAVEKINS